MDLVFSACKYCEIQRDIETTNANRPEIEDVLPIDKQTFTAALPKKLGPQHTCWGETVSLPFGQNLSGQGWKTELTLRESEDT